MRFKVWIDVKGDWTRLGTWKINLQNPYNLANALLSCVADTLNTRAMWIQDDKLEIVSPNDLVGCVGK